MKNIAYAGAMIAALDVDMGIVTQLLDEKFAKKKALRASNLPGVESGLRLREKALSVSPAVLSGEDGHENSEKILIDGKHCHSFGLRLRRRDRRRMVSHYAVYFSHGRLPGLL